MTFSYSGDPTASLLDEVRFLIQDTEEDGALFSNEEINYTLGTVGNNALSAAIALVRVGVAKYSRLATKNVGDLSIQYGELSTKFRELLPILEAQRRETGGKIRLYAGGISKADKEANERDTDNDQPEFKRDQFENKRFP